MMRLATVPDEAIEIVAAINSAEDVFWGQMRDFNQRPTGTQADSIMSQSDDRDEMIDQLRRKFFPRAARVTVDRWGVYTWSPTGRIVRMVWSIPQPDELEESSDLQ